MQSETLISKKSGLVMKGVGILLMLFHHLFYAPWSQELYNDISFHGFGLVNQLAIFSKVCVSIFVFISGYGLTLSFDNTIPLKEFYFRRFKKLFLNYWFIWLLFVPLSIFVFNRSLADAYGNDIIIKLFLDLCGLIKLFGSDSYNPTWWFYSCISILYLLFPLFYKYLFRVPYLLLGIAVSSGLFGYCGVPGVGVFSPYLLVFIVGMLTARMPLHWIAHLKPVHIITALLLLCVYRLLPISPKHVTDTFICLGIAFLLYKITLWEWLSFVLCELGKHSMNMFLVHSFLFHFWFSKYIYITRSPLVIFISLILSSYLCSIIIEYLKRLMNFNKI